MPLELLNDWQWLSAMQLALRQDREADLVMFVVTQFTKYAADWRDVMPPPQVSMNNLIPWNEFEKTFPDRFVPIQASHAALEDFKSLKMQNNMSINEYNAMYLQERQEINNLPHIDVPDATTQLQRLQCANGHVAGLSARRRSM